MLRKVEEGVRESLSLLTVPRILDARGEVVREIVPWSVKGCSVGESGFEVGLRRIVHVARFLIELFLRMWEVVEW